MAKKKAPVKKKAEGVGSGDLKKIFPARSFELLSGEKVQVSPIPFGKLTMFTEAVSTLLQKLDEGGLGTMAGLGDVGRLFDVAFEEVIALMGLVLDKDREWFDQIEIADGIGLAELILEQNFGDAVKKNITALRKRFSSIWLTLPKS